ncbi:sodium:proton antiporter, partial [Corynebacterium bovis]
GQIPLDPNLRIGGDLGNPIAISEPDSEAGIAFGGLADTIQMRRTSLAGRSLSLGVTRK